MGVLVTSITSMICGVGDFSGRGVGDGEGEDGTDVGLANEDDLAGIVLGEAGGGTWINPLITKPTPTRHNVPIEASRVCTVDDFEVCVTHWHCSPVSVLNVGAWLTY